MESLRTRCRTLLSLGLVRHLVSACSCQFWPHRFSGGAPLVWLGILQRLYIIFFLRLLIAKSENSKVKMVTDSMPCQIPPVACPL